MKIKVRHSLTLALFLCISVIFGSVPHHVYAVEPYEDPKVTYELDEGISSISANTPFGATFTFQTDENQIPLECKYINIDVLCPNSSIRIGTSHYKVTKIDLIPKVGNEEAKKEFKLYLSEKQLMYLGTASGTLQFRIYYMDGSNKICNNHPAIVVQKTITQCVISRVTEQEKQPSANRFLIAQDSTMPTITAGTSAKISIPLITTGYAGVGETQISVGKLPDKIALTTAGGIFNMNFYDNSVRKLNLSLAVGSTVAAGVYEIPLKISYESKTEELITYLNVLEATNVSKGKLYVQNYKLDSAVVHEGQKFNLTLTLSNSSNSPYHNVSIGLGGSGLDTDKITVNGALSTKNVGTVKSGETRNVTFPLMCHSKMATGNYILEFTLAANDLASEQVPVKAFVSVQGTKTDSTPGSPTTGSNASKPIIVIESYDYGGHSVTGGKEFNLVMNCKNTSTTAAIENVKMTISSVADGESGGAFTPAKSSNTFFIPKVGTGQTFTKEIALYPKADALPKSYGVAVTFEYEAVLDGKRETLKADETISIPLTQPDRFEVSEAEVYGPIEVGGQGQLNINYVNKGKSKVFNLSITLVGNFTSPEMTAYVGNVESGAGDSFQTTVTPTEEGTLKGTAKFTYEDANGETKEFTKEFSCEVLPPMPVDGNDPNLVSVPMPVENSGGFPTWALWLIIGVCVIIGTLVVLFIHKKRKTKKQRLLDEIDDYEEVIPEEATVTVDEVKKQ